MRSSRLPLLTPAESRDSAVLALAPNSFDPSQLQNLALYLRADAGVQSDTALQLDAASSQYLVLDASESANFNMGTDDFTIATWVYLDSLTASQYLFTRYHSNNGFKAFRFSILSAGNIFFDISGDGNVNTSVNQNSNRIIANQWYFIIARYDGSTISVRHYDTSELLGDKTSNYSSGMFASPKPFLLGSLSNAPSGTVDGRLDSVAVYKGKALSNAECDTLWNSGNGQTYADLSTAQKTSLLAWWDMNEASGTRTDSHSSGYNLTEGGGPVLSAVGVATGVANDEDSVSLWLDQSATGSNASQGNALLRPTFQAGLANSKPGLTFDGSDDILSLSNSIDGSSDFLIAWVEGYTSGVSTILSRNGVPVEFIRHDSATSLTIVDDALGTAQVTHANIGSGNHISMLSSESGTVTYYLDGTSYALATSYFSDWFWGQIGEIQGDLMELIYIEGCHPTPGQRNQLGRYLARKHALTWNPT